MASSKDWLELGRIGSPYGIKGWVHVQSYTEPAGETAQVPRMDPDEGPGERSERCPGSRARRKGLKLAPMVRGSWHGSKALKIVTARRC